MVVAFVVEDEGVDVRTAGEVEVEEDGVMDVIAWDAMMIVLLVTKVEDFHHRSIPIPNPPHRIVLDG